MIETDKQTSKNIVGNESKEIISKMCAFLLIFVIVGQLAIESFLVSRTLCGNIK